MLVSLLKRAIGAGSTADRYGPRLREGYACLQAGDASGAQEIAQELLARQPQLAPAHLLLAQAQAQRAEWHLALAAVERALARDPTQAEAFFIRGMIREQLGESARALEDYARVLNIDSVHAAALDRKGALHDARGEFSHALDCAEQLVHIDPKSAHAFHKLGITLRELGQLPEAAKALQRAVALDADLLDARCHLALVLIDQGRFEEAEPLLQKVLLQHPDHAPARWGRAVSSLLQGRFEHAWDDYEFRESRRGIPLRLIDVPEWDGRPIDKGHLLLTGEQGLGDQIMFASCIEEALRLCPQCVVECDPRLVTLFRRSFPAVRVYASEAESTPAWRSLLASPVAAQLPIASLPGRIGRRSGNFPVRERYLIADAAAVTSWRERLNRLGPGAKIGLSWTGGAAKTRRGLRSIPLEALLPLFRAGGDCQFISLQYVDSRAEIEALREGHGIIVHRFDEIQKSYDDTAALIGALDLVISVCTSVIHLAGALGAPVWAMVPAAPEWRYMQSGERMPWYASVKLWRQNDLHAWQPVIEAIAAELTVFCARHAGGDRTKEQVARPVMQTSNPPWRGSAR